uniref:Uncharacterized protein n=1 Tax=Plectus sambesii TaxID=2011161 RepID=A0A914UX97_9BILA
MPSNGTQNQHSEGMQVRNSTWDSSMKRGKVCFNQMKKLSNGTENLQNKEMQLAKINLGCCIKMDENREMYMRNFTWDYCIEMVTAYPNLMKKLSNGTQNQQNKEMYMRDLN